jgi:hypothetical protein
LVPKILKAIQAHPGVGMLEGFLINRQTRRDDICSGDSRLHNLTPVPDCRHENFCLVAVIIPDGDNILDEFL